MELANSFIPLTRTLSITPQTAATRNTATFNTMKRTSTMLQAARTKVSPIGAQAKRAYSSEMANALVQVSQNACLPSPLCP